MNKATKFGFGNKADVGSAIEQQKIDAYDMIVAKDTDELGYVSPEGEEKWFHERLGEDITINGVTGLGLANGQKLSKDWTAAQALKALVQKAVKPTYNKPTASIANNKGQAAGAVEAGTSITPKLRATFTKNDAGELSKLEVLQADTSVGSGTSTPYDYTGEPIVIGDESISFTAKATYNEGAIKNDNLGQQSPEGHILAGNVTSSAYTITGQRNLFYGTGMGLFDDVTSQKIRNLQNKKLNPTGGSRVSLKVETGQQYIVFALPSPRVLTQVIYDDLGDKGMLESFEKKSVQVADARGESNGLKDYSVYVYNMSIPCKAPMNFTFVIG